uniref:Zinc finger, CCHC-type n=1 Tax=Tanacetum cinerariifolium TaxID=118510 RepID=A0A6L2LGB7_TANCI|nr:zinc finger, CCHC-type [Tanacetum cinerariifolium]
MDVKTAFLNGKLEEEVHMNQHQGFIMPDNQNKVDLTNELLSSRFFIKDMGEADIILALAVAGKEAEWLRNLILDIPLWSKPIASISIRCDSFATLARAYIQMYNGRSRHLVVSHNMIGELILNRVVSIEFVRSQQNLADHLTKGLARDLVLKSAEGMGLKSNKVAEWGMDFSSNNIYGHMACIVVSEHPDSDSGKREFKSLMKFNGCSSGVNGIHQSDGFVLPE